MMIVSAHKKRPFCKNDLINLVFSLLTGLAAVFALPSLPASAALIYFTALCLAFLVFVCCLIVQKRRQRVPSKRSAVVGLPSTTATNAVPSRSAVAARQCPAAWVVPVLSPVAPV